MQQLLCLFAQDRRTRDGPYSALPPAPDGQYRPAERLTAPFLRSLSPVPTDLTPTAIPVSDKPAREKRKVSICSEKRPVGRCVRPIMGSYVNCRLRRAPAAAGAAVGAGPTPQSRAHRRPCRAPHFCENVDATPSPGARPAPRLPHALRSASGARTACTTAPPAVGASRYRPCRVDPA